MFLPVTVVAELELNGVRPPPDKNEEEERDLITKRIRENLIHKCNESVEIVERVANSRHRLRRKGLKSLRLDKTIESVSCTRKSEDQRLQLTIALAKGSG